MARVSEPMPDRENQGHYKDVFDTSNKGDTGEPRPVDDFAPRTNLKKLFMANKVSVNNKKEIEKFSIQYAVEEEHVTAYVQHTEEQKACALIRAGEKQQKRNAKKQKSFVDYDWKELQKSGKLHSLTKPELQHYLKHCKLSCHGRKDDWVQRISSHLLLSGVVDQAGVVTSSAKSNSIRNYGKNVTGSYHVGNSSEDSDSDEGDVSSSEDQVVAAGPGSEGDKEEEDFMIPETVTTRSGRVAGRLSTVILH